MIFEQVSCSWRDPGLLEDSLHVGSVTQHLVFTDRVYRLKAIRKTGRLGPNTYETYVGVCMYRVIYGTYCLGLIRSKGRDYLKK